MKESKEMLRQRFEAQTDIELAQKPDRWKSYAEWLERLACGKINHELIRENEILHKKMQEAMVVLEQGVTGNLHLKRSNRTIQVQKRRRI